MLGGWGGGVGAPRAHMERERRCSAAYSRSTLGARPGRIERERAWWAPGGSRCGGGALAERWGRGAAGLNGAGRGGRPPLAGHCLIRCTAWRGGGSGRGPEVKYRPGQECGADPRGRRLWPRPPLSPPAAVEETPGSVHPSRELSAGSAHWTPGVWFLELPAIVGQCLHLLFLLKHRT